MDILEDAVDEVPGVELKRIALKIPNGAVLGNREYDILARIGGIVTRVKCKSSHCPTE